MRRGTRSREETEELPGTTEPVSSPSASVMPTNAADARNGISARSRWAPAVALLAVAVFGALCLYHYRLPGLYYDESFDVVPSMQLLKGEPVQLARGVGIHLFGHTFPVMTGDYWGSVSTYAVLPLFWLLGVGVLPVRLWPIGAGMVAVFLTYFTGKRLYGPWVGAVATGLLAIFPSFIFWSRVGIYVISHIVAVTLGVVLSFLRWKETRHRRWLFLATLLAGIGLWTKLLYLWFLIAVPAAYVILLLVDWATGESGGTGSVSVSLRRTWQRMRADVPVTDVRDLIVAGAGFLIGAFPVIYYNLVSRGSYLVLRSNLFHTENGVNNFAIWSNVKVEADAVRVLLDGGYFWFYGGIYTNPLYPWVVGLSTLGLLVMVHRVEWLRPHRRATVFLAAFAFVVFVLSCFTVSILGATHLLILLPVPQLFVAAFALFSARWLQMRWGTINRASAAAVLVVPVLLLGPLAGRDLWVDARYHRALVANRWLQRLLQRDLFTG